MNVSCKIKYNNLQKSIQIWNPHAKLPVDNELIALECIKNLAMALRHGFRCTHVDGHPCKISQLEIANILRCKAIQIAAFAESRLNFFDNLIGALLKTDSVKIHEFKLTICNYDLFKEHSLHRIPPEINANIFNRLDIKSYLNAKSTCHSLRSILTAACQIQEIETSTLKARRFQALSEARKKAIQAHEKGSHTQRGKYKTEEFANWPDY